MSRIYAIEGVGTGLIKLGRASNPERRKRELQVGSPVPLRLLCAAPERPGHTESDLHVAMQEGDIDLMEFEVKVTAHDPATTTTKGA